MTFIATFPSSHVRNIARHNPTYAAAHRQANHIINRLAPVPNYGVIAEVHVHEWMSRNIDLNELGNRLRHQLIPGYNRHVTRGMDDTVYALVRQRVNEGIMEVISNACRNLSTRELERAVRANDILRTHISSIEDQALEAYEAGGEDAIYELVLELAERAQARRA